MLKKKKKKKKKMFCRLDTFYIISPKLYVTFLIFYVPLKTINTTNCINVLTLNACLFVFTWVDIVTDICQI